MSISFAQGCCAFCAAAAEEAAQPCVVIWFENQTPPSSILEQETGRTYSLTDSKTFDVGGTTRVRAKYQASAE